MQTHNSPNTPAPVNIASRAQLGDFMAEGMAIENLVERLDYFIHGTSADKHINAVIYREGKIPTRGALVDWFMRHNSLRRIRRGCSYYTDPVYGLVTRQRLLTLDPARPKLGRGLLSARRTWWPGRGGLLPGGWHDHPLHLEDSAGYGVIIAFPYDYHDWRVAHGLAEPAEHALKDWNIQVTNGPWDGYQNWYFPGYTITIAIQSEHRPDLVWHPDTYAARVAPRLEFERLATLEESA